MQDYIAIFKRNLKVLCGKLPDGGKKLRESLKRHVDELDKLQQEQQLIEDLEMVLESDREIEEAILRYIRNSKDPRLILNLLDGGEKFRENLKRYKDELKRRREHQLANKVDDESEETIQVSDSDDAATRTTIPDPIGDLEMVLKSDPEIEETIASCKRILRDPRLRAHLPDGGEKIRANLKRHKDELERLRECELANKVDNECEETIQVSESDDAAARTTIPNLIEDLEMVLESDREIEEAILRYIRNSKDPRLILNLLDGGEKFRENLKWYKDELKRRREHQLANKVDNECEETKQVSDSDNAEHTSAHNHHHMEIDGCKQKGLTLLSLDRNKLLPLSTDRPPQIIMTSNKKPKYSPENSYQTEDLELVMKSDRELNEIIAKLRANLKRHQDELQRRQLNAVWLAEAENLSNLLAAAAENC